MERAGLNGFAPQQAEGQPRAPLMHTIERAALGQDVHDPCQQPDAGRDARPVGIPGPQGIDNGERIPPIGEPADHDGESRVGEPIRIWDERAGRALRGVFDPPLIRQPEALFLYGTLLN
jgi:hypothetical protein